MTKTKRRRLWKNFHIENRDEWDSLYSYWQNFATKPHHMMHFGRGVIETNLPFKDIKRLFLWAGVSWRDYVTDTRPLLVGDSQDGES